MKKILYFLYFFTLSIHASLEVKFTVTGPLASDLNVCLANEHKYGKHICSHGSVARHYKDKKITTQIFYVEYRARKKYSISWDQLFPKGVNEINVANLPVDQTPRSIGLSYNPSGTHGLVSIAAKSRLSSDDTIMLYDICINDQSK